MLSCNDRHPLLFSRPFLQSLVHLHVWLAPSCPSLCVCTISMTAASENFSCRLSASGSRAQGTLPSSASGGPPVPSLTPYSLLCQPSPPMFPLLPITSYSSSTSALCSLLQPLKSAEAESGISTVLNKSAAWGRMHLLPCFCNNTVLICLQIYLHGSLPEGEKEGRAAWKGLPGIAEYGRESKQRCKLIPCSLTKLFYSKLPTVCHSDRLPWDAALFQWANRTIFSYSYIPQPSNHMRVGVTHLPNRGL